MDDKKLNYSRPILSVRRHPSSTVASQKDVKTKPNNSLPVTSRPPPYRSEMISGPISNPGAVPFQWESTPGQPKYEIKPQTQNCDKQPLVPILPPGRYPKPKESYPHLVSHAISDNKSQPVNALHESRTGPSADGNAKEFEEINERTEDLETSDSGDSDEAYVDAHDTLSRTESCFLNCSVSGVSGMDGKPYESFSRDPQTREFMMDRFLPAAKAMTSETPQFVPKKQPVIREQTQVKKILNQDKPSLRYGPSYAEHYSHYPKSEEDEEESDDDNDQRGKLPTFCGLVPRFCLKSSLCLLSPVPSMSVRTRVPISPSNRPQSVSSSYGSYRTAENETESEVLMRQSNDKFPEAELEETKTSFRDEKDQLESRSASPYCDAPMSFPGEKEVLLIPEEANHPGNNGSGSDEKGLLTFQRVLADQGSTEELDSETPAVKKTVHVDNVRNTEHQNSRPLSPNIEDSKGAPASRDEKQQIVIKGIDNLHVMDSSLNDSKKFETVDGETEFLPTAHRFGGSSFASSIDKSNKGWGMENQNLTLVLASTQNSQVDEIETLGCLERKLPMATTTKNSRQKHSKFLIPPPLPKSPSDSWLCRTLPSMSTRRSYLGASAIPQNQNSKAPQVDFKWEAIVKSSNLHRQHLRYSEEQLMPISET